MKKGEKTTVTALVRQSGLNGRDVEIELLARRLGTLEGAAQGAQFEQVAPSVVVTLDAESVSAEILYEPQVTGRRSPSNIGAAYFDDLFWDGRATSTFTDPQTGLVSVQSGGALESQSLGPILSFVEMADTGRTWNDVVTKLARVEPLALATDLTPDLVATLAISGVPGL